MRDSVAVLGLGAMGNPIARRIHSLGKTVIAFDPDVDRLSTLAQSGIIPARSPAHATSQADFVVVFVANPAQAEEALFGDDGAGTVAEDLFETAMRSERRSRFETIQDQEEGERRT
jgi:3-hydroxyisobutyrate dehydrogenase-like beta-hydroxyacid dehydrogenase